VPKIVALLVRADPRLLDSPAGRSLVQPQIDRALVRFKAGDALLLGNLIIEIPPLLRLSEILDQLVSDIGRREMRLLGAMLRGRPKRPVDNRSVEVRRKVRVLRKADTTAVSSGVPVWTADGVRVPAQKDEERINDVARELTNGENTGLVQRKGTFARVKKIVQRLDPVSVQLQMILLPCFDHVSATRVVEVIPYWSRWQSTNALAPSLAQLRRARVIDVDEFSHMPMQIVPADGTFTVDIPPGIATTITPAGGTGKAFPAGKWTLEIANSKIVKETKL
jgi:hypothetical protein